MDDILRRRIKSESLQYPSGLLKREQIEVTDEHTDSEEDSDVDIGEAGTTESTDDRNDTNHSSDMSEEDEDGRGLFVNGYSSGIA